MIHSYYIIGAGLAAVLIAEKLIARGVPARSITLCAPRHRAIASDVPGALMHPLPGTTLAPKPDTMLAYGHSREQLTSWQRRFPEHVLTTSMLRPDRGARKGARFIKTYTRAAHDYHPAMAHRVVEGPALRAISPELSDDTQRAVLYGPTYCVALGALLPLLLGDLHDAGVTHHDASVDHLTQDEEGCWQVHAGAEHVATAEHVIMAMGGALAQWFPRLEMNLNGGELAVVHAEHPLEHMISGGGHICAMPSCEPERLVMGSTYLRPLDGMGEHDEGAFLRTDEEATAQLRDMIGTFYAPAGEARIARIWRGARAVYTPDKHPLIGPHPLHERLYILGALGSKGLLWAPLAAEQLTELLTGGLVPKFSEPCRLDRTSPHLWQSPKITALPSTSHPRATTPS